MTADRLTQFCLLYKKNIKVSVLRNPRSFVKELAFPALISILFLWIRGYMPSNPVKGFPFPRGELRSWPPGLEPWQPDKPANETKEWILMYNNGGKAQIDSLVNDTVNRMNDDAIMWYSYEEYLLDSALYTPIRDINVTDTEFAWSEIKRYATAFLPHYRQRDKDKRWFSYMEKDKDSRQSKRICSQESIDGGACRPTTNEEKRSWIEKQIIENFKGDLWDACNRPKLANGLFQIAKQLACTPPGPSTRAFWNNGDDMAGDYVEWLSMSDCDVTKKASCTAFGRDDDGTIGMRMDIISGNLARSEFVQRWRDGEYEETIGRRRRSVDLSTTCQQTSPGAAAKIIHETFPRMTVKAMAFDTWDGVNGAHEYMRDEENEPNHRRLGAIQFHNTDEFTVDDGYPAHLNYSLRFPPTQRNYKPGLSASFRRRQEDGKLGRHWRTGMLRIPAQIMIPRGIVRDNACTSYEPGYHFEGFTIVQSTLDNQFIRALSAQRGVDVSDDNDPHNWRRIYKRFPFGQFSADIFPTLMQIFSCLLFVLGTMSLALSSIKNVVAEKECRIKEYMKIMGASSNMQWYSWTAYYATLTALISGIMTYLLASKQAGEISFQFSWLVEDMPEAMNQTEKEAHYEELTANRTAVLAYSDPSCIFLALWMNLMQVVWFNFALSSMFSSSASAGAVAGMLHFFSSTPWLAIMGSYADLSYTFKVLSSFFPSLSIGHLWYGIVMMEGRTQGLKWSTMWDRPTIDNDFSMAGYWIIMGCWIDIYFVFTWWYEQVFPGEFGVSKVWYFFVTAEYWCPSQSTINADGLDAKKGLKHEDQFEALPPGSDVSVALRGLRKEFKTIDGLKVAVDCLHMDMCRSQITSLLGHNGAGKTTTMNMLTGMMEPTAGTAVVNGHDIRLNMEGVRSSLGLCPQFDILFPTLTIQEHLQFFAVMKGVGKGLSGQARTDAIQRHVAQLVKTMRFRPYVDNYPTELSGGWKRRLSVCIALIGGSKTVFLDEPTSGMDPSTRRILWGILLKMKKSRTMILSTHFMDEADILGDRVAIMSDGVLEAIGSSTFLKNHFGAGYHVMLSAVTDFDRACEDSILGLIREHVSTAKVERNIGQEMSVLLPFQAVSCFDRLFAAMDKQKTNLGIATYGIQLTSLDEVFLKCTEKAKASKIYIADAHTNNFVLHDAKEEGFGLRLKQFRACLRKNYIVSKRDWMTMVISIFVASLLAWAVVVAKDIGNQRQNPRMNWRVIMGTENWADGLDCKDQILPYFRSSNFSTNGLDAIEKTMSSIGAPDYISATCGVTTEEKANSALAESSCDDTTEQCFGWDNAKACDPRLANPDKPGSVAGHPMAHMTGYHYEYDKNIIKRFDQIKGNEFDRSYLQGIGFDTTARGYGSHPYAGEDPPGPMDFTALADIKNTVYMMFNGQHYHTVGYTVNLASRAILKYVLSANGKQYEDVTITAYNHPLGLNQTEEAALAQRANAGVNQGMEYSGKLLFAWCIICALFTKYKVTEKASKAKHVQYLTGLDTVTYWLSFYLVDFIKCAAVAFPTCLTLIFYADDTFGLRDATTMEATDPNDLRHAWLYMFAYLILLAWAMLPWMYMFSLLFDVTATAVICLILFVFYPTNIYFTVVAIWRMVDPQAESEWPSRLDNFGFAVLPPYVFQDMITTHYSNNESKYLCTQDASYEQMCEEQDIKYQENYWAYNSSGGSFDGFTGVGYHVVTLLWQGVFFFSLLCLIESFGKRYSIPILIKLFTNTLKKCCCTAVLEKLGLGASYNKVTVGGNGVVLANDDEDVRREAERCESGMAEIDHTDVLVTKCLRKVYDTRTGPLCAVDGLSFGVKRKTCFGLLGVNGAGKTTAFKMLTGDEDITSGDCSIDGHSMITAKGQAQKCVGYCPQFNALIDSLSGRETVEMYCDLRGLSTRDKQASCDELLRVLDLTPHMNKECGIYSGGNKRKLSVALAMVGEPPLLFLDEPSTGMDPGARHALWDSIVKIQTRGTSVILTSHSMEECEALCSKLVIMVNGKFQCFGAVQHLRSKFGQGYTLEMEVPTGTSSANMRTIKDDVMTVFSDYVLKLKEQNAASLVYDVPITDKTVKVLELATLFSYMEVLKKRHNLVSYSVRQRTLEEMFLNFTRCQRTDDRQQ